MELTVQTQVTHTQTHYSDITEAENKLHPTCCHRLSIFFSSIHFDSYLLTLILHQYHTFPSFPSPSLSICLILILFYSLFFMFIS